MGASFQNESDDDEELPLTRNRSRHASSSSSEARVIEASPTSTPMQENDDTNAPRNTNAFPSDEVS